MMKKEVLIGIGIAAVLTVGVIFDALTWGPVSVSQTPNTRPTLQAVIQSGCDDDVAEAVAKGPDTDSVEDQVGDWTEGVSEAEAAALAGNHCTSVLRLRLTMRMVFLYTECN
jgi:hypothetical protein